LSREVPKHWMEFLIISCNGKVGWEGVGSPYLMTDPTITHHIIDRPPTTTTQQGMCYVYSLSSLLPTDCAVVSSVVRFKPHLTLAQIPLVHSALIHLYSVYADIL
jgi:hypothetical protein